MHALVMYWFVAYFELCNDLFDYHWSDISIVFDEIVL